MWIDPFTILGVDREADDDTVKRAYLAAVKVHSPEQDPAGFQRCRAAYEKLATQRERLTYCLTRVEEEPPTVNDLMPHLASSRQDHRPDVNQLRAVLAEAARNFGVEQSK